MTALPTDAAFLEEVLSAFGKRRKAIRYRVRDLEAQRTLDKEAEKLSIECKPLGIPRTVVRLFVWSDRWVSIDARRSSKSGWIWQFTDQGRLSGGRSAKSLIQALEDSIAVSHGLKGPIEEALEGLWKPFLAKGPRSIS